MITFRAPGRVNLIGEHTDYNAGFVMPAAINLSAYATITPRDDRKLQIRSDNFSGEVEVDLDDQTLKARRHWSDYPVGVAVTLERAGHRLRGGSLAIKSEVPMGSGLSSSAAVEVSVACALAANSEVVIDRKELALLCQKAENEFVGARVGIMDQFVSLFGEERHALMLDCRSLEYKLLPVPETVRLVVCDTMVKHANASSGYNERRAQCEAGVKHLAHYLPHVKTLRDVTIEELEEYGRDLPDVIYRRCRHVITENARVIAAAQALNDGDLHRFRQLMAESHLSLRDDYEVSSRELDLMVELAAEVEGVYGARMTGGGFGGCTINLVDSDHVPNFNRIVAKGYEQITSLKPEIYVCEASKGAEQITS
ncbi:MAG TPA: galactokinase [Pyrinomonadaceae bacterium]|nr:galactokinase [Pyrinomonadaceae bacterium]